jgi:hypothetical protein
MAILILGVIKFGLRRRPFSSSFVSICRFCILASSFLMTCCVSNADEKPAFILKGSFDDTLMGKHFNGGFFIVRAYESNALVDVMFENGYREITGTDGRDTFTYNPFTGDKTTVKNWNGIANISSGRFPTNAHFFEQVLWLVCVHDPELLTNLQSVKFPFYGDFQPKEIVSQIRTSGVLPDLVTSIKWYAPGKVASGTNRYESVVYPEGILLAEVAVTETKAVGEMTLPTKFIYTQYSSVPVTVTNLKSQFGELRARNPDDVVPVEVAAFSITNAQADQPLSSYVPEILDKTAHVNDKRTKLGWVQVDSGKWWTVREVKNGYEASVKHRRLPILIFFALFSLFPIYLLLKMVVIWKNKTKKTNADKNHEKNKNR